MDISWINWRRAVAIVCVVLALVGTEPTSARAQQPEDLPLDLVERAFTEGRVDLMMGCAADRLEMAVLGSGTLYSRGQAVYVMEKFFRQHPPRDFNVRDLSQAGGNWFATGVYWASGERQPYRVYLRFERTSDTWILIEIRIGGGGP